MDTQEADRLYEESLGEYFYHQGWTDLVYGHFDWRRARRYPDYWRGAHDARQRLRQLTEAERG